jgi:hypothetical protein
MTDVCSKCKHLDVFKQNIPPSHVNCKLMNKKMEKKKIPQNDVLLKSTCA